MIVDRAPCTTLPVEKGQQWASLHGGTYSLFEITEVLEGRYLRPPDVAIIPCEFVRVRYIDGRLAGQERDVRASGHRLGFGSMTLYRHSDGRLTEWGKLAEEARVPKCHACGRPL